MPCRTSPSCYATPPLCDTAPPRGAGPTPCQVATPHAAPPPRDTAPSRCANPAAPSCHHAATLGHHTTAGPLPATSLLTPAHGLGTRLTTVRKPCHLAAPHHRGAPAPSRHHATPPLLPRCAAALGTPRHHGAQVPTTPRRHATPPRHLGTPSTP